MQFENTVDYLKPALVHAEPLLPVNDVAKTVSYWCDVLGFTDHWMWGDPPNHAGISWHGAVPIQLSLNPELATKSGGHCVWIRVRQLTALYEMHQKNKATITAPLQHKPWGFDEYIVKEINGHYLVFTAPGGEPSPVRKKKTAIRIAERAPTFDELCNLARSVKWTVPTSSSALALQLQSTVYSVVAESQETNETIGCAFLMGDGKGVYYVKDVIVHPKWQRQFVGTEMMQAITRWLDTHAREGATAGLFCGEQLAPFYQQFKFTQACGMYRVIEHEKK